MNVLCFLRGFPSKFLRYNRYKCFDEIKWYNEWRKQKQCFKTQAGPVRLRIGEVTRLVYTLDLCVRLNFIICVRSTNEKTISKSKPIHDNAAILRQFWNCNKSIEVHFSGIEDVNWKTLCSSQVNIYA